MTYYKDVVRAHQEGAREDLVDSVDLLLTGTPCNTNRHTKLINSDHDRLTVSYIDSVSDLLDKVLTRGGHGAIFCLFM